ncbi:beta strand repeat-containing protein [Frigoriglobus tundricola]|uniref:PL9 family polysaccharide lyase n=1 Tax=Frigoriglobus tundricola TaxID=2774151 RepID=A0A6M5YVI1_9BACT|nr:right-handed parallel beta-helix repeat-containing protein [Frigoriglobus tundricola]QJW98077.1 PL9 family polysaccharide lyase [Frigoriglobus tundricola]
MYYVSTAGADAAAGDAAHPWLTLQHAADTVQAGDTVNVLAGNYAGFCLTTTGTASARITFTGQAGADITSDNPVTADGINIENASYVTVQGFTVTGAQRAGIRSVTNTNVIIQNNDCDQNAVWGIFSGFSKNLQILNNVASRSAQQHGIYVSNSDTTGNGNNPTISGNTVWGNHDCGIELNGDLNTSGSGGIISGATVTDNVIYDNGVGGGAGINCDGVQNSVFENNLVYNEHATGISLSYVTAGGGSSNNRVVNNTVLIASDGRWALNIDNQSTGNTVLNNILDGPAGAFPGAFDVSTDSLTGLTSDYNLVENKLSNSDGNSANLTLAQWQSATGQDAHSVTSAFDTTALSALFGSAASGNYHLIAGSPAINIGTATDAPATDAKGTLRPSGAGVDIGYDEYSTANITTHFQVSAPATATAGTAFTVTVTAQTGTGATDTGYRGTVHFTSTDGQAGLPADYTFTAADAGIHTFTVTLQTVGSESVTATDTATGAITGAATATVASAGTTFAVSAPSAATAGTAFTVTVTAQTSGGTNTGYRGTVHFTSTDGQAVLPANYTFTAADAGVHTFTVTLKTAGSESITATDTVTGAITGTATTTVSAASASTLQVSEPATATAGSSFSVTVTAKDAYGNVATGYRGMVHFTSTDGQAVLPANYTFTAADAGAHTFTVTLKTAGSESVTATDTVTGAITGTATTTVSAASASVLQVSEPTTATAGTAFSVTATLKDAYGNVATGYRGMVHFTSTDGQAVLPANYTFTAADAGAHTFTVTLKTAGSESVTATDTVTGAITGTATTTVSAASASVLQVSEPTTATAGTAFSVTATLKDAYGNVATGYRGTVHFTSTDGQAVLPANYTFTAADAGAHTFTVTLKTAGSKSVTATDTVTSALTSSASTTVSAASASVLQVSEPATATAGSSFSVTVTAKDAYGNVATGYRGTVHFTSTDGQAVLPANYTFTAADAGAHTFTVTLKTAGSESVTATDTVTGAITGTATTTVSAASASVLQVSEPTTATAGTAFSVTATLKDAYGNVATGYRGTVHFTSTDGQAVLPANYTFTVADAGAHTFTVTLKTAGSKSVTVTDTVTGGITGTATTTVSASSASVLQVSEPTTATVGSSFSVTVTAKDAYGNVATGYLGTVHFTSTDGQAVLPANYTFTVTDAGVHTFAVTLESTGSKSVTATDTVTNSITGIGSTNVNATAPPPPPSAPAPVAQRAPDVPLYAAGSAAGGSGVVSAYSPVTGGTLIQFQPFGAYTGGVKVAVGDVTGDGYDDLIVMAGPGALNGLVEIYSGKDFSLVSEYFAFPGYQGEFNIAAGDVTGSGVADVIFSTATGGDFVFAYAGASTQMITLFSAFGGFTGGVTIAAGDVQGVGRDQIIVGTASQVGAAGVFNTAGQLLQPYYFAPIPMNGVNVAAGDLNNSGHDDIIFGARTGSTLVLEYDGVSQGLMGWFFAYPGQSFGVTVATEDPTGDGYADIVTGFTGNVSAIALYSGLSFQLLAVDFTPAGTSGLSVAGSHA